MTHSKTLAVLVIFAVTLAGSLAAASTAGQVSGRSGGDRPEGDGALRTQAVGIIQYDDGEVDDGYQCTGSVCEMLMLFEGIGGTDVTFGSVEVCFTRLAGPSTLDFEVVLYDDDGAGGSPGTQLASFPSQTTGIPVWPSTSISSHSVGYETTDLDYYVGVRWSQVANLGTYFCIDEDGSSIQPGYRRNDIAGSWESLTAITGFYNAMVLRAFVFTPGVVQENQYVPFFLVDTLDPSGTSTLFAVRNKSASTTSVAIDYFDVGGTLQSTANVDIDPGEVFTENLRFAPGLATDFDGMKRGWVQISTAGNPDGTHVLSGDFFQIDDANDFATGDRLATDQDFCQTSSTRFLKFGPDDPSRFRILIRNPRGTGGGDPASFSIQAYNQAGTAFEATDVFSDTNVVVLDQATLTALNFGTLTFDFSNSGGGVVYSEHSAFGSFSVGLGSDCDSD